MSEHDAAPAAATETEGSLAQAPVNVVHNWESMVDMDATTTVAQIEEFIVTGGGRETINEFPDSDSFLAPLHEYLFLDLEKHNLVQKIELLLKHGADPNGQKAIYDKDGKIGLGDTPLHWAVGLIVFGIDGIDTLNPSPERIQVVNMLLQYKADVNIRNYEGNTALHACRSLEAMKILLDSGADINALNNKGQTPLLYQLSNRDLARKNTPLCLIERGANLEIRDKEEDGSDGKTAEEYLSDGEAYYTSPNALTAIEKCRAAISKSRGGSSGTAIEGSSPAAGTTDSTASLQVIPASTPSTVPGAPAAESSRVADAPSSVSTSGAETAVASETVSVSVPKVAGLSGSGGGKGDNSEHKTEQESRGTSATGEGSTIPLGGSQDSNVSLQGGDGSTSSTSSSGSSASKSNGDSSTTKARDCCLWCY